MGFLAQKRPNLAQNMLSWAHWPCWFIWCPISWCLWRADTYLLYFKYCLHNLLYIFHKRLIILLGLNSICLWMSCKGMDGEKKDRGSRSSWKRSIKLWDNSEPVVRIDSLLALFVLFRCCVYVFGIFNFYDNSIAYKFRYRVWKFNCCIIIIFINDYFMINTFCYKYRTSL